MTDKDSSDIQSLQSFAVAATVLKRIDFVFQEELIM